jgi:hypothetical protein
VWSVTLTTLLLTRLLGWRKHVCMNYVVSEREMAIAPQDLFSANQIIHLRPICGHDVFARFLQANAFVRATYPNWMMSYPKSSAFAKATADKQASSPKPVERVLAFIAPLAELVARHVYRRHLEAKARAWRTRDQVRLDDECLKLHTTSHRASTLSRFDAAMAAALACEPAIAARR